MNKLICLDSIGQGLWVYNNWCEVLQIRCVRSTTSVLRLHTAPLRMLPLVDKLCSAVSAPVIQGTCVTRQGMNSTQPLSPFRCLENLKRQKRVSSSFCVCIFVCVFFTDICRKILDSSVCVFYPVDEHFDNREEAQKLRKI